MTVTMSHCGSSVSDTYLHLLDASGTRLDYNDDYGGTGQCSTPYHSFLQKVLTAGTYYVVSEGYSQNGVIVTNISGVSSQVNTTGNTMQNPIVAGSFSSSFQYVNSQNTTGFTSNYGRSSNDVYYRFTLNTAMTVTIKHCNSPLSDTYLYLLDASGNLIVSNDDYSGTGQCSSHYHSYINRSLPSGTYYAVSEGYNANGVIQTSITGEASQPNPTGNTMQNPIVAGTFSSAFQYSNSQNSSGFTNNYSGRATNDVFYRFTLNTTMTVTIKHCNSSISDTYLYLLDASGNLIISNDDYSGEGSCSSSLHSYIKRALPAGTYYAVSEGYSANGVILTSISGEASQPNPTGNTMQNAIVAGTFSSTFQYSNSQNSSGFTNNYSGRATNDVFYRFTLNTAMTVTVSHCGSSLSDTYLHLLDASGNLIESNDDYSGTEQCSNTLHSLIRRTLNAGTYYVVSEGYSANGVILTSIASQPNPTGNTMQNAIVAGTFGSAFQYSNSQNTSGFTNSYNGRATNDVFYRFTLNTTMTVTISHCSSTLSDTYLHLLNASGGLIESNDNYSGEGQCSNMYHSYMKKSLPAGTYYVVSEGYSANGVILTTVRGEISTRLTFGYDASGNRIQRSQAASLLSAEKEPEKEKDPEKGKDPEGSKEEEKTTEFGKPEENTADNSLREGDSPSGSMTVGGIGITVYPNPTKGQVNIEIRDYSDRQPGEIRLYSPTGALLSREEIRSAATVVDMTGYLSGLYLLNIHYNGEAASWKIIKH